MEPRIFRRKRSSVLVAWLLLVWGLLRGSQYLMAESYTPAVIYGVLVLIVTWLLLTMRRTPKLVITETGLTIANGPLRGPASVSWEAVRRVERLSGARVALVTQAERIEVSLTPFSDTDRNNIVALLHQHVSRKAPA